MCSQRLQHDVQLRGHSGILERFGSVEIFQSYRSSSLSGTLLACFSHCIGPGTVIAP